MYRQWGNKARHMVCCNISTELSFTEPNIVRHLVPCTSLPLTYTWDVMPPLDLRLSQ